MEQRIKELYAACLRGVGVHGIDGEVSKLRQEIQKALDEGVSRETVEKWLEQVMLSHFKGGHEM